MSENANLFESINSIINNEIRPFIEADGGRIELKEVKEDGSVFVELAGACSHCPSATITLKSGVERILKSKLPEVKSVDLWR